MKYSVNINEQWTHRFFFDRTLNVCLITGSRAKEMLIEPAKTSHEIPNNHYFDLNGPSPLASSLNKSG